MYRIQRLYKYSCLLDRNDYLLLAFKYTIAMFSYWMFPNGVGEMTFPLYLPGSLREEGFEQEAAILGGIFDKKAAYFDGKQFSYGYEMASSAHNLSPE